MSAPDQPAELGEWPVLRREDTIADARRKVRRLAARVIADHGTVDDVELMASELLTNAVRYGEGDKARVRVTRSPGPVVRVEVRDDGRAPVREADTDPFGERGRGLLIVAALADAWGVDQDDGGTTAWFEASA